MALLVRAQMVTLVMASTVSTLTNVPRVAIIIAMPRLSATTQLARLTANVTLVTMEAEFPVQTLLSAVRQTTVVPMPLVLIPLAHSHVRVTADTEVVVSLVRMLTNATTFHAPRTAHAKIA